MCDTMVATADITAHGCVMLAKNSDRVPNEAQNITFVPAAEHPKGATVKCTHIEIPQAARTFAVLLSRPFWMYGAEMGVNEHGVAIGNEAVFTREPLHKKNDALTGMDILRLALERTMSAAEARDQIVELLARFGQGGRHAPIGTAYYHNSFLIADAADAFILETAGTHWVWKRVERFASISNCLSIEDDYDAASPGLEDYARSKGFTPKGRRCNFARDFSDRLYTHFAKGRVRLACSSEALGKAQAPITTKDMMEVLRSHNMPEPYQPGYRPMERICLHAGGLISTQTTGSMLALIKKGLPPLVYFTGTSAPCLSLYRPHVLTKGQRSWPGRSHEGDAISGGFDLYGSARDTYDASCLWWKGEDIHRRVLLDYARLSHEVRGFRDEIEGALIPSVERQWLMGPPSRAAQTCASEAEGLVRATEKIADKTKELFRSLNGRYAVPLWFLLQWRGINKKAGFRL